MEDGESLTANNTTSPSHSLLVTQRSKEHSQQCKICGASALHSNYGVISCSPCKMFFKRNAVAGQKQFKCDSTGQCEINMTNRHICSSCRLAKCFGNGMQSDLIRCPTSKKNTIKSVSVTTTSNILTQLGARNQLQQLPTVNLLQSDNSTLCNSQWTLLSNLVYSYDESKLLSIAQQFMNENDIAQSTTTIDLTLPNEFFVTVYETSGRYLRSNGDFCSLSSDDRSAFFRNASKNVTCLGAVLSWSRSQLYNCKSFVDILKNIYGEPSMGMIQHVLKYIDPDIVVVKLALSLFTFSNNTSIFSTTVIIEPINTLAIFRIQNTYAEITWKYLLYKYGFNHSTQRFMNLIQCLLAATDIVYDAHNIAKHVNDIELLVEKTELGLLLDDVERIDEQHKNYLLE